MNKHRKFYKQFFIIFVPCLVLLTGIFSFFYVTDSRALYRLVSTEDQYRINLAKSAIQSELSVLNDDVLFLSQQPNLKRWIASQQSTEQELVALDFENFMESHSKYNQVRFISDSGKESIRIDRVGQHSQLKSNTQLQDKSERYYVKALNKLGKSEVFISELDLNIEQKKIEVPYKPMLRIGTPVFNQDKVYAGSVILNFLGEHLLSRIRELSIDEGRQIWLLNEEGYWLLGPEARYEWGFMLEENANYQFHTIYPEVWNSLSEGAVWSESNGFFSRGEINTDSIHNYANNQRWYLIAYTSQTYIDDVLANARNQLYLLYLFGLLLLGFSSYLIAKKETVKDIALERLQRSEKQYRDLLESAPDPMFVVDERGSILLANAEASAVFGYSKDELISNGIDNLLPQSFREKHKQHRDNYLDKPVVRPMGQSRDLFALRQDGSEFPVEVSLSPQFLDDKKVVTAIVRDVTSRKMHEQEIKALNKNLRSRSVELEAINKELEAFSYSVSHDLRAPLRAIDGFSQTLASDYEKFLDERGKDRLLRIRTAAQKMGELIDDMINLSRVTRVNVKKMPVNLSQLAQEVCEELNNNFPGRSVDVVIEESMMVEGDHRLLYILLSNLFSNAWKFTGNTENPKITFYSEQDEAKQVFTINDNGAGFDMDFSDKLFIAFQRLHDDHEFPGTGIGLATVMRVIKKHHGQIWASSEVGKGAKFSFILGLE